VAYLRGKGVASSRLQSSSLGASRPLVPGVTSAARRRNMRIELRVAR
jgi:outer membrane protein OmpA-like peptidoglycan-associated protein